MKIAAIIQARVGSTRLPGKVLMDIAGKSMLMRTVERVQRAKTISEVIVATSDLDPDNAIVSECIRHNVPVFRGSETDVLDRYVKAAEHFQVDTIVRITSDCPLVDPDAIDRVVGSFMNGNVDFASNFFERTDPRGFDTEVVSLQALKRVHDVAKHPDHREHPTLLFYLQRDQYTTVSSVGDSNDSQYRLTVDTMEDLQLIRSVYDRLGTDGRFSWQAIKALMEKEQNLLEYNRNVCHKILPGMTIGSDEKVTTM